MCKLVIIGFAVILASLLRCDGDSSSKLSLKELLELDNLLNSVADEEELEISARHVGQEKHVLEYERQQDQNKPVLPPAATYCNRVLNATRGQVTSPDYPEKYPPKQNCTTTIDVGHRLIEATFVNFSIEYQSLCQYDYLQIFEVYGDQKRDLYERKICGQKDSLPKITVNAYYKMKIVFVSDFNYEEQGFKLEYDSYPLPDNTCIFGTGACAFKCHCEGKQVCNSTTGACPNDKCLNIPANATSVGEQWTTIPDSKVPCQYGNVALYKKTDTVMPPGHPTGLGTDGLLGDCTHPLMPNIDDSAYWSVDLGTKHKVYRVIIYNGANINESTLGNFYLRNGNVSYVNLHWGCNMYKGIAPLGAVLNMSCGVVARYISIIKVSPPKKYELQFDEVMVMGHPFYDVDCNNCDKNCRPGIYCEKCKTGFAMPDCRRRVLSNCLKPPSVANGEVMYNLTVVGSELKVQCLAGYQLVGDQVVVCEISGQWGALPKCSKIICSNPPALSEGNAKVSGYLYGDAVMYGCNAGYILKGDSTLNCTMNGTWSGNTPSCESVDCGSPSTEVENGKVTTTNTFYEAEATITCMAGFSLNGGKIVCGAKGSWEIVGGTPACQKVGCGQAPAISNGKINVTGTSFQSIAVYTCNSGYQFEGDDEPDSKSLSCTSNGKWSGIAPFCEQECGGQYKAGKGIITSPQYPENYNNERECTWLVYTEEPGRSVMISFSDFALENFTNCAYDSLTIKDIFGSRSVEVKKLCGTQMPKDYLSKGHGISMTFVSDQGETAKGFKAGYSEMESDASILYEDILETFYPELSVDVYSANLKAVSEAIVELSKLIYSREGLYDTVDCLNLYESVGAISYIVVMHSYPQIERYFSDLLHHMVIHSPLTDDNAEALYGLMTHRNYSYVYETLIDPLYDLAASVSELFGLKYYEYPPVVELYGHLIDVIGNETYSKSTGWKVVSHLAQYKHVMLMTAMIESNVSHHCDDSLKIEVVSLLHEAVKGLKSSLENLPKTVKEMFGPSTEYLADIFLEEVEEHMDILQHPFVVLANALDIVEGRKVFGQMSLIPDDKPKFESLLQYAYASILNISREEYIFMNVFNHTLTEASMVIVKEPYDITLAEFQDIMINVLTYLDVTSYSNCMKAKLAAMVSGMLEVKLYDIVMVDFNASGIVKKAVLHMNLNDSSRMQDISQEMHHNFRSVLFSTYREELLRFDEELEELTGGSIMAETFPLDLLFAIQYIYPVESYILLHGIVETVLPLVRENISCPQRDISAELGVKIEEFLSSFDETKISSTVDELMMSFSFYTEIDDATKVKVKRILEEGLDGILHKLLKDVEKLEFLGEPAEDWDNVLHYIANGTAKIIYSMIQLSKPKPHVDTDALVEVIELQQETLKNIITHYMETIKRILKTIGNGQVNICEAYPQICDLKLDVCLSLEDSEDSEIGNAGI